MSRIVQSGRFLGRLLGPLLKKVLPWNIMKIVKSLEESDFLTKGVSKTIKNEVEERKGSFLR